MTKKELLEAIKDMPEDAEVEFFHYEIGYVFLQKATYHEEINTIELW